MLHDVIKSYKYLINQIIVLDDTCIYVSMRFFNFLHVFNSLIMCVVVYEWDHVCNILYDDQRASLGHWPSLSTIIVGPRNQIKSNQVLYDDKSIYYLKYFVAPFFSLRILQNFFTQVLMAIIQLLKL